MAFRTDYSKYELVCGKDDMALELCTGGGPEDTAEEDIVVQTMESEGWKLAVTADRGAKFIFGVTLQGDTDIIFAKPQVYIEDNCTMVMSRIFAEYEQDEPPHVYFDNGVIYIVIGNKEPYRIRYQTYDPLLRYTFQYDADKRLRCIQLVPESDEREKFPGLAGWEGA